MSSDNNNRDDYDDVPKSSVEPHRGVLILVLGILGLMMCGAIGIAAYFMGKRDLELIRAGKMDKEGEPLTKVGYILGIVACIKFILEVLLVVGYILIVVLWVAAAK